MIATFCFLINADQIVMDAGYGIVNFVYLYCLGYYIRHHYIDKHGSLFYLGIYILACIATFAINTGMSYVMGFYFNSMISYNTIFTLVGAVGIFLCFKHLKIKGNRVLKWSAKHSLAVYLIHMCPPICSFVFTEWMGINSLSGVILAVVIAVLPLVIYLASSVIDSVVDFILMPLQKVRLKVFSNIKNKN